MSPNGQRIAIAEACGWVWYRLPPFNRPRQYRGLFHPAMHEYPEQAPEWLVRADGTETNCNWDYMARDGHVPDYLSDLNACHEMEKVLDDPKHSKMASSRPYDHAPWRYLSELAKVCKLEVREEMVVSCAEQFRPAFDKVMKGGPPFKLPVGVCILSHFIPAQGYETCLIRATAAQRAEAFLRTIGKWEENEQ